MQRPRQFDHHQCGADNRNGQQTTWNGFIIVAPKAPTTAVLSASRATETSAGGERRVLVVALWWWQAANANTKIIITQSWVRLAPCRRLLLRRLCQPPHSHQNINCCSPVSWHASTLSLASCLLPLSTCGVNINFRACHTLAIKKLLKLLA